jgi:hypothetical protein
VDVRVYQDAIRPGGEGSRAERAGDEGAAGE